MPRPEKVQAVAEIKERIDRARAVFLAEYAGLSVSDQQALRRGLRRGGAEFKVVKMTLARLATADLGIAALEEALVGPTGLTFADEDAVVAARVLRDFAKDHEVFTVTGGLLGRDFLTPERVAQLADIEPRDVLLSKVAGAFKAPLTKFAGLLQALPRGLAVAMQQLVDKKSEASDAAAAEPAAAEPAVPEPEPAVPEPGPAEESDETQDHAADEAGEEI